MAREPEIPKHAGHEHADATSPSHAEQHDKPHEMHGPLHAVGEGLRRLDASLEPVAGPLRDAQNATRGVANAMEQGVDAAEQGVEFVAKAKGMVVQKGLEIAGKAIADSHVLDPAKPLVKDVLQGVNAALQPIAPELQAGAAATGQMADVARQIATTTKLDKAAEFVDAVENIRVLKEGATHLKETVKRLETHPLAAPALEKGAQGLPFKEPSAEPLPKLVVTKDATQTRLVTRTTIDSDAAIENSITKTGQAVATESSSPYHLKQGNFGERMATHALAEQGHDILEAKPDIKGTNQGGIDIVTMKDGVVHVVDNKAYTTGKNISSVSALDKNFNKNIAAVRERFDGYAKDPGRTAVERSKFAEAVEAIDGGRAQKVVTTAALARDGMSSTNVSAALQSKGIQHLDLDPQSNSGASAASPPSGPSGSAAPPAPSATRMATPPTASGPAPTATPTRAATPPAASGAVPQPQATQSATPAAASGLSPKPSANSGATQGGVKGGTPSGGAGPGPSAASGLRGPTPSNSSPNGGI